MLIAAILSGGADIRLCPSLVKIIQKPLICLEGGRTLHKKTYERARALKALAS
jgi:mannose-1-phosphate guanylyltransferase